MPDIDFIQKQRQKQAESGLSLMATSKISPSSNTFVGGEI
jgi:hypothetical protein